MAAGSNEKRGFIRVPFNTTVEVKALDRVIVSKEGINISMSGVRLSTREVIPPANVPCQVTINLGGSESPLHIVAKGATVRSHGGVLAVKFIDLDLDSYQHLRQLIVNNAADPDRAEEEFSAHWGIRKPRQ